MEHMFIRNITRMTNRISDVGAHLGRMKGDRGKDRAGSSPRTSAVLFHSKQSKCFTNQKSKRIKPQVKFSGFVTDIPTLRSVKVDKSL